MPFELVRHQVLVDVLVDGKGPFVMHFDTAVSPSGLDTSAATAAGVATGPPVGYVAGLGSRRIPYSKATLGSIGIGSFRLADLETIVWDSSHLKIGGLEILGTLGESFFRRTWVQIDYPGRTVRLAAGAGGSGRPCPEGSEALAVEFATFPRLLDVQVDGQPITATLDSGASGALHLSLSAARRLGLGDRWSSAEKIEAHGARGAFEARKTRVDSLRIGSFELRDVETLISSEAAATLIGNRALENFVLTLDYAGRRVCLGRPGVW